MEITAHRDNQAILAPRVQLDQKDKVVTRDLVELLERLVLLEHQERKAPLVTQEIWGRKALQVLLGN